jgi:membrane-associated PAP2 superfamily phosphatase
MALARLFVDATGANFAWRDSALLDILGHQAARGLPFLVGALAIAGGAAGFAVRALRPWTPILLTTGTAMLLGPLAVNVLKGMTTQHCPIALQSFGGVVDYATDQAAPFWASSPQSAGHCLPSGHAGGGYAPLSLYFASWAAGRPAWRWRGLAIGIAAGLLFSIVRMMQGAHFASATLWSATVDWTVCATLFLPLLCRATTRAP